MTNCEEYLFNTLFIQKLNKNTKGELIDCLLKTETSNKTIINRALSIKKTLESSNKYKNKISNSTNIINQEFKNALDKFVLMNKKNNNSKNNNSKNINGGSRKIRKIKKDKKRYTRTK